MKADYGHEYGVLRFKIANVPEAAPINLTSYLTQLNVPEAAHLLFLGSIYLNEVRVLTDVQLKNGDSLRVHSKPRRYEKPKNLSSRIVEQTDQYLIFDKPAGIPVHSQVDNLRENLISFLEEELNEELFITHRLDIVTSGCLLIARTLHARSEFNKLFRDRLIKKNYVAETEKYIEPTTYVHFMKPSFTAPKEVSDDEQDGWIRCELKVLSSVKTESGFFANSIELITGRPQQIRAQLAYLGAPIIGDTKYGSKIQLEQPKTILLRCSRLDFDRKLLQNNFTQGFSDDGD